MIATLLRTARGKGAATAAARTDFAIPAVADLPDIPAGPDAWHAVEVSNADAPRNGCDWDVDVWVIPTASMASYAFAYANLNEDEIAHARTLRREEDRVRYVAIRSLPRHALLHTTLTEIGSELTFNISEFGKPELAAERASLSFSISHAESFSVIAITSGATIGIDVEKVCAERVRHLPTDCFTARERRRLDSRSAVERTFDFFRLWTLKEAYTKALGLGFSAEFDRIEFDPSGTRLIPRNMRLDGGPLLIREPKQV
jgi:4'-phosphopantetheinyl transferase